MKDKYDLFNQIHMDFSIYEEEPLTEKERCVMKKAIKKGKKINYRKAATVAVCAAAVSGLAISQTAWAKDFMSGIIKVISVGQNRVMQMEQDYLAADDYLKNNVLEAYDKDGNSVEFTVKDGKLVDKEGNELKDATIKTKDGDVRVSEYSDENTKDYRLNMDMETAKQYIGFDYKLPEYIPEGFVFSHVQLFKNDNGEPSPDYAVFVYKRVSDGKEFFINERYLTEDTAYEMGTQEEIKEINVNGNKAAVIGGYLMEITMDDTAVSINSKDLFNESELIKIAEGLK